MCQTPYPSPLAFGSDNHLKDLTTHNTAILHYLNGSNSVNNHTIFVVSDVLATSLLLAVLEASARRSQLCSCK